MKAREVLGREHALFSRLLDALERGLERPDPRARAEISAALRILLPALDRHEELEDLVFRDAPKSDRAVDLVNSQHEELAVLRRELLDALELSAECPIERLRALARFLIAGLRSHLTTEESLLWPRFKALLHARLAPALEAALGRRVRAIERNLRRSLTAISSSFH